MALWIIVSDVDRMNSNKVMLWLSISYVISKYMSSKKIFWFIQARLFLEYATDLHHYQNCLHVSPFVVNAQNKVNVPFMHTPLYIQQKGDEEIKL